LLVGAVAFALAPGIASLLGAPDIAWLIRGLAVVGMLAPLTSFSLLLQVRDLKLAKPLGLQVGCEAVDLIVSIVAVAITRSPWGLVIGRLAYALTDVVGSYLIPGFTPRLQIVWSQYRKLFRFSRWVFLSNLFFYLSTAGDDLAVGSALGTQRLGLYRMAYRLGSFPVTGLGQALDWIAFPSFARINEDAKPRAAASYRRYLILTAGVMFPIAALIAATAPQLIDVLLGSAWHGAVAPLTILAVAGAFQAVLATGGSLFLGTGRPQLETAMQALRALVLFAGLAVLLGPLGITGAAIASLLSVVATMPVWTAGVRRVGIAPRVALLDLGARLPAARVCALVALGVAGAVPTAAVGLIAAIFAGGTAWAAIVAFADRPLRRELVDVWRTVVRALKRTEPSAAAPGQARDVVTPAPAVR
jgi:O-antigen/teichoic acid export membrane protein